MNPEDAWFEIWKAFHITWGNASKSVYDKAAWMRLQELLQQLDNKANLRSPAN